MMKYNWKNVLAVAAVSLLTAGLLAGCGGVKKVEITDKPADAGAKKVVKVDLWPNNVLWHHSWERHRKVNHYESAGVNSGLEMELIPC